MTPEDRKALAWFEDTTRRDQWADRPHHLTAHQCGSFVRRGYLISATQSERVRGERRVSWKMYKLTLRGFHEIRKAATP